MEKIYIFSFFFLSSFFICSLCARSLWSINTPLKELKSSKFKRICVYAGTGIGIKPSYQEAAIELGKQLVEKKIDLVYGGGTVGLMGFVARTVQDGGGHVLGVIPKPLMTRELIGKSIGEVKFVRTMHERKSEMIRQADAFIALPGGYGTLEEVLEVVTWAQIGIHHKPVGLLNVDGYYDSLLSFIDNVVDQQFMSRTARGILVAAPTPKQLIRKLEEYVPEYDEFALNMKWEESNSEVNITTS